ncbi:LacI family DNA-binding transcriptional regulator [Cohnella algarum]|uniref:LacI family DNA-binding transcriptional regulator n=1 Tax=Cohnella algarum TaxID=2044859 RepID=UPI0019678DF3|nr:LacI family DNA-binding transcriptional regulator [Cohnella algarum]MBN2982150.1 LacI family DNA-binding transcriptional regulator [Cohnella algarum]
MAKKPTLRDVAREAGVSVATVSYVLNNVTNQTIPQETRNRVYEAAEKLNYIQNLTARSLSVGRTNLLGALLVAEESDLVSKHISYGKFIDRLERLSNDRNYHLMVSRIDPGKPNFAIIAERKLDGVFVIDASEDSFYAVSEKFPFGSPVVLIDSIVDDPLFRHVSPDFDGLFELAGEIAGKGRPFAVIHERYHNRTIAKAIRDASGLGDEAILAADGDAGAIEAFIGKHRDKPLVVFNEFLALRLMKFADPDGMIVVCTSDCPEYLPERTGKIVPDADKARAATDIMHALLQEPYDAAGLGGKLTFRLP